MENSFAQQLEEFRHKLQYSIFERQIKFERTYPKWVETLEVLNKKYRLFADTLFNLIIELKTISSAENEDLKSKLTDFNQYAEDNRLLLPSGATNVISSMYVRSSQLLNTIFLLSSKFYALTKHDSLVELVETATRDFDLQNGWFNFQRPQHSLYVFLPMLLDYEERLEQLYRTVAETNQ